MLVACFKDANSNIRIVGVAVVASETTNTWSWFLQFLKDKLVVEPSFIVSDRDKGLQRAALIFDGVPHFFCLRHPLENFNKKFKSAKLQMLAKALAYSLPKLRPPSHHSRMRYNGLSKWDMKILPSWTAQYAGMIQ